MAQFGEILSRASIVVAGALVLGLLLIEFVVQADGELFLAVSFLAGLLAPILAVVGFVLVKVSGNRASRLAIAALAFGCVALAWPLLFVLAYSNCPGGLC